MEKYNPTEYLLKIQKIKYNEALIPILLIFSSFAINFIKPYSFVKYLSLLGLLAFFFISLKYRIRKNIPPEESGIILSPVYGVVTALDLSTSQLTIKKGFFTPADYRFPAQLDKVVFIIDKGKITLFETTCHIPGKLIGILPLSASIICNIPEGFKIMVEEGQKIIAGETILAAEK